MEEPKQPGRAKRFIKEALRVLRITKKPGASEYKTLLKISGLGVTVIGVLGFIIFIIKQLLF